MAPVGMVVRAVVTQGALQGVAGLGPAAQGALQKESELERAFRLEWRESWS